MVELAATTSRWRRADVVRQVARRAPANGDADEIEEVADQIL